MRSTHVAPARPRFEFGKFGQVVVAHGSGVEFCKVALEPHHRSWLNRPVCRPAVSSLEVKDLLRVPLQNPRRPAGPGRVLLKKCGDVHEPCQAA